VTLAVPGMTCPTCPVTMKKALMKEQGVASVTRPRHTIFSVHAELGRAALFRSSLRRGEPFELPR
jgi:copper chaperone CopZ